MELLAVSVQGTVVKVGAMPLLAICRASTSKSGSWPMRPDAEFGFPCPITLISTLRWPPMAPLTVCEIVLVGLLPVPRQERGRARLRKVIDGQNARVRVRGDEEHHDDRTTTPGSAQVRGAALHADAFWSFHTQLNLRWWPEPRTIEVD